MSKKSGIQNLSKKQKKIKDLIPVLFKHHDEQTEESWLSTGKRLLEFYNGRHYKKSKRTDAFTYNAIFSDVQTLLPVLVLVDPLIRAKAKTPTYLRQNAFGDTEVINNVTQSFVVEAAVNHEYRACRAIEEVKKSIFDNLFWGFGVTKTGYSYKTIAEADDSYVEQDSVFLKRINPRDFGFHPIATSPKDSPQLCHRLLTTKSKIKENDNYDNAEDVIPSVPTYLKDKVKDVEGYEKQYVELWEVHDQENDKLYTFGGSNKILLWERERESANNGSDFQLLRFAYEPDEFIGVPYLLMIEDEQMAMDEVLTLMVNHMHQFPGRAWTEEGSVDVNDIEKIRQGGQGAIQSIRDINKVKFQSPLQMGSDYFNMLNVLQSLKDRTLGIPDFVRSANPQRKSASESSFIKSDVDIKRQFLGYIVKDFILQGVENMAMLMQEFFTKERFAYSYGSVDFKYVKYTKEDLQGEYQFDFDVDTISAGHQTQVQELINALNILAAHPSLAPILSTMDPMKLGREIFKKMNMNIEAFQSKPIEETVFIDAEKENLVVLNPEHPSVEKYKGIIPDPKENENHDEHIEKHFALRDDLKAKGQSSEELDRHLLLHGRFKDKEAQSGNPAMPMQPNPAMGKNGPGPQPTPMGPVNLPGQAAAGRVRPQ